ncbi:tetratricopeptide repeat protein, partial [bacterium]|nr:tetratricopeptide repeat protein [bacterium]
MIKLILLFILIVLFSSCFSTDKTVKKNDNLVNSTDIQKESKEEPEKKSDEIKDDAEKTENKNDSENSEVEKTEENKENIEKTEENSKIVEGDIAHEKTAETDSELKYDDKITINNRINELKNLSIDDKISKIDELIKEYPKSALLFYNKAFFLYKKEQFTESESLLQKALEIRGDYGVALSLLFEIYNRIDGIQKARTLVQAKLTQFPNSFDVKLFAAQSYYKMRNYKDAILQSKESLKLEKDHPEALKVLAMSYYFSGSSELAFYVVSKAEEADINLPELLYIKGLVQFEQKRFLEAKTSFSLALDMNSQFFEVGDRLAFSELKLKNYEEAAKVYEKTLLIKKKWSTYLNLGTAYYQLNQSDKALDAFLNAEKLGASQNIQLYYNLGMLYLTKELSNITDVDRFDKAIVAFEKYNSLLQKKDFKELNADSLIMDAKVQKGIAQAKANAEAEAKLNKEKEKSEDKKEEVSEDKKEEVSEDKKEEVSEDKK